MGLSTGSYEDEGKRRLEKVLMNTSARMSRAPRHFESK